MTSVCFDASGDNDGKSGFGFDIGAFSQSASPGAWCTLKYLLFIFLYFVFHSILGMEQE